MSTRPPLFLCIGDLDVDVLIGVDRLPTRDSKVNGTPLQRVPGGMAGNVAVALSRLGAHVRVVGRVGSDENGAFSLAGLNAAGIDTRHVVQIADAETFTCISLITPDGEKSLVKIITPAYLPEREDLPAKIFQGVTHAHLTFGRHPELSQHIVASAHIAGATCSLDMELADLPSDPERLLRAIEGFDILFCNVEARAAMDRILLGSVGSAVPAVVTTLGAAGSQVESPEGTFEARGFVVDTKDTTGAGDCFAAALLQARLMQELPWSDALRFANAAAALSTRGLGAQSTLPTRREAEAMLGGTSQLGSAAQ